MSQDSELEQGRLKHGMWIQLKKQIGPENWNYKEGIRMSGRELGLQTKIDFKPKLTKENKAWKWGCTYYHNKVTLDILLSFKFDNKGVCAEDADLRVCYIPKSSRKREVFMKAHHPDVTTRESDPSYESNYKSYVWIFDICLVKMVFNVGNEDFGFVTKNFHLDSKSGNCQMDDHFHSSKDEFAHFQKSAFLSKDDLEKIGRNIQLGYHVGKCPKLLIKDIELTARLRLVPLVKDIQVSEWSKTCVLDMYLPETQLFQSDKLSVSAGSLFVLKNKSKLIVFDVAPDVTFKIMSASSTTTMGAHSLVLSAQSPVFSKMLTADMLEKKTGIVNLEDGTSAESLKLFLSYLYEQMNLSYSNSDASTSAGHSPDPNPDYRYADEWTAELTLEIIELAHKYHVQDLTHFCIENIISRPDTEISGEVALEIFKAGVLYDSNDMKQRSVEWTKRQDKEVKMELKEILLKNQNAAGSIEFLLMCLL